MTGIHGICPIIDTPFTSDGDVHYENLEQLVNHLAGTDVNSLAMFGFASEYYALSDEERRDITQIVVDTCSEYDTNSIISITPHATKVAVQEAQYAERVGADALMILPPHIRVSSPSDIIDHIEAVANAVDLPMIIQYAPEGDGVGVPPDAFARLFRDVENVEYFKIEANPPGKYITALLEQTEGEPEILVGNAGFEMIDALDRGATGVMPASAMYDIYLDIYDQYTEGNREDASDLHGDLLQMLNLISQVGIQVEKNILVRRGLAASAHCRDPVNSPDDYHERQFEFLYETYISPHLRRIDDVVAASDD